MREDINKFIIKNGYESASKYIKKLLQSNPNDARLWYALFLADNKGYENMDMDNIKNEIIKPVNCLHLSKEKDMKKN